ncbi:MAG: class I SAM-dependent methyltransferase [Nitrospinae bacterium]|nr:class I SAM-dependent methyltransferase [Nitrospinota bacterium]
MLENIIFRAKSVLYKKYWQAGFATRLYDLLAPEAYLDSLQLGVECAPAGEGKVWLDAGCGSGLALRLMADRLRRGDRYVGIDLLTQGLFATLAKAKALGLGKSVLAVRADLSLVLPLKERSVDIVLAHFIVNTVGDAGRRGEVLNGFRRVLKAGGTLVLTCPSRSYDPENIVRASLASARERYGNIQWSIRKWIYYPLALALGLRHVENQLKTGVWRSYTLEELCAEVRSAGFEVHRAEPVYASSAYVVGAKPVS